VLALLGACTSEDVLAPLATALAKALESATLVDVGSRRAQGELELRLLGPLEVRRGEQAIALPASKKARALLGYLVATGRAHVRDQLCSLLWEVPDNPRAALRWTLTKIRPLLDEPGTARLVAERDLIRFDPKGVQVDLLALRAAVPGGVAAASVDALARAAGCFRGEFLEGLDLSSSYRFHAWCVGERDSLRELRLSVLRELIRRLEDRPEEALRHARERLGVEPLSEAAYVDLVRLLAATGRAKEALREYETCKAMLEREHGTRPSAALEVARSALRRPASTPPPRAPTPAAEVAPPKPTVSLVGREAERALLESLATEDGPSRPVVFVMGDPGIGKTRLLEELGVLVRARGGLVLSGRAFEAEQVRPYGPWIDALRSAPLSRLPVAARSGLGALLPEVEQAPRDLGDRTQLFAAVERALALLGEEHGLALLFDDLQWFDEGSAALLHSVARAPFRTPPVILCTARRGELEDNRPALGVRRSLQREHRYREIALAPLDVESIRSLIRQVAPAADAQRVFAESSGNPLFALEIARSLAAGGDALPESLDRVIQGRLDQLEPGSAELLPWAAALGRSFGLETLEAVVRLPPSELLSAAEDLERRAILRPVHSADGKAGYDFVHDLIREAAYRRISAPLRQLIHRRTAQVLAALPDPFDTLAAEVARHAALGGEHEVCVRASIRAAERCLRVFANADAVALADLGLRHVESLAETTRIRLTLSLLRIHVKSRLFRTRAAELESRLRDQASGARSAGLHADVAFALHYVSELREEVGDFAGARESTLQSAAASRSADAETTAHTLATTGRCLAQIERDMDRAEALLLEAQAIAVERGIDVVGIPVGLGIVRHHRGDDEQAIDLLELGLANATRAADHWIAHECLTRLTMVEIERGRPRRALERCRDLLPMAAKMGGGSETPFAEALRALAEWQLDAPSARDDVEGRIRHLRDIDTKGHFAYVQSSVAAVEVERGQLASGRERAAEALAAAEAVGRPNEIARARAILARVASRTGDRASAAAHIEALAEHLRRPLGISQQARDLVADVAREVGIALPTDPPTPSQSVPAQDPV
jgi:DNA-binding SARP family transcriptional activator/tetratricopeptide (TPR) repeat protein